MSYDRFESYIRKLENNDKGYFEAQSETENDEYVGILTKNNGLDLVKTNEIYEYDLAIINGSLVIPDKGIIEENVYIKDGIILSIGRDSQKIAKKTIDANGRYVIPGIVDPHVHLGIYDSFEKEIESETRAALHGGVTTIGVYFGGQQSHFKTYPLIQDYTDSKSYVDVIPHFVISTDEQTFEIRDYNKYFGVNSFKVYMNGIPEMIPDVNDGFIINVYEKIRSLNKDAILCVHAENNSIIKWAYNKVKKEKGDAASIFDWTNTHPVEAEVEAIQRIAEYAKLFQIKTYIVHVSSKEGIETLARLRENNSYIYGETTSPYLSVTRDYANKNILMEPPVRDIKDVEGLWKAVGEGIVDAIGTDNVSLTEAEKKINSPIWEMLPGYSVLETHLATILSEGYHKRGLRLEKLIPLLTKNPAKLFGVYPRKGTIAVGSDADLVLLDINRELKVSGSKLMSRTDFSPYEGKILKGWATLVVKNGVVVVDDGVTLDEPPLGEVLK